MYNISCDHPTNSNLTMGTCSKHMDPYKISPKVILNQLKYSQYLSEFGTFWGSPPFGFVPSTKSRPSNLHFLLHVFYSDVFPIYAWGKGMIL